MRRQGSGASEELLDRKLKALAVAGLNWLGGHLAISLGSDEADQGQDSTAMGSTAATAGAPERRRGVTNSRSGRGQAARCWKTTVNGGHSRSTKPQVRAHIGWSDAL